MESNLKVKIQADKLSQTEYLVKDMNDILIGRFKIIQLNVISKRCDIELKFYRDYNYNLLRDTLNIILKTVFKNVSIFKINIKVSENISVNAFLDVGFTLQGILPQNEYFKGEYLDELSFGITRSEYNKLGRYPIIQLNGENIVLKNLTPGDAEELLEYYKRNKNHLAPFEPDRDNSFYTLEIQQNLLSESYRQFLSGTSIEIGIFKEDKLIGKMKLSNIVYGSLKSGVLGYSIDKYEQGKGYIKESVKLFIDYAFNECDLHRIEASALVDNERSRCVLTSCGFKLVGINERYLMINGKWQDHATYYILKE